MTAPLTLRRWQTEAIPLALANIEAGGNGIIVATTGAGKSIALAEMLRRYREVHPESEGRIVVTTPSKKLVKQLAGTFAKHLGDHVVGRFFTNAKQWQRPVIVCCNASVQTLAEVLTGQGIPVALWVADEAHKSESDQILREVDADPDTDTAKVADVLGAVRRLGFTATPFRSQADERLSLFDKVVYVYPPADALRDGVIVPWRVVGWDEDREEDDPDLVCALMIEALGTRAERGPGVVNALSIADAEAYCAYLGVRGIVALPIHSRMSTAQQEENTETLRRGEIDCLVHVSMLVEGVDYPWLRWGCLRRPVGARVRFIQEVGRFIRACEDVGKTEAVLLDPHDLFGTFQLTYEAALGWEPEPERDPQQRREQEEIDKEGTPKERRVARTAALGRYVRQLYIALLAEGRIPDSKVFGGASAHWRQDEPSPQQMRALRALARKNLGRMVEPHRAALARVANTPGIANKGIASDALSLVAGLGSVALGEWAPASPVPLPPDAAFEAVALPADDRWYAAGGMRGGRVAAVVVHAGEVPVHATREQRPGDTWTSLTLYAVAHVAAAQRKAGMELAVVVSDQETADVLACVKRPTRKAAEYLEKIPDNMRVTVEKNNPATRLVWKSLPRPEVEE